MGYPHKWAILTNAMDKVDADYLHLFQWGNCESSGPSQINDDLSLIWHIWNEDKKTIYEILSI